MPEVREASKENPKFLVVEDDGVTEIFNDMESAREYIADNIDEDCLEDVKVFRFIQEYKINSNKKILFSKV